MQTDIQVGDFVRSYDYEYRSDSYVEGVVEGFTEREGCKRLKIAVTRRVRDGVQKHHLFSHVFPPVNGVFKTFGGVTDGVILLRPNVAKITK